MLFQIIVRGARCYGHHCVFLPGSPWCYQGTSHSHNSPRCPMRSHLTRNWWTRKVGAATQQTLLLHSRTHVKCLHISSFEEDFKSQKRLIILGIVVDQVWSKLFSRLLLGATFPFVVSCDVMTRPKRNTQIFSHFLRLFRLKIYGITLAFLFLSRSGKYGRLNLDRLCKKVLIHPHEDRLKTL